MGPVGDFLECRVTCCSTWKAKCPIFKAKVAGFRGFKLPLKIGHKRRSRKTEIDSTSNFNSCFWFPYTTNWMIIYHLPPIKGTRKHQETPWTKKNVFQVEIAEPPNATGTSPGSVLLKRVGHEVPVAQKTKNTGEKAETGKPNIENPLPVPSI